MPSVKRIAAMVLTTHAAAAMATGKWYQAAPAHCPVGHPSSGQVSVANGRRSRSMSGVVRKRNRAPIAMRDHARGFITLFGGDAQGATSRLTSARATITVEHLPLATTL